jgi:hypothetical protein
MTTTMRMLAVLGLALALTGAARADAPAGEECTLVRALPDGALVVHGASGDRTVEIFGVVIAAPRAPLFLDVVGERLPKAGPMRCTTRATPRNGRPRVQIFYFAWQDKSGDVWEDLALSLIDMKLARVSAERFRERPEYLRRARRAHL